MRFLVILLVRVILSECAEYRLPSDVIPIHYDVELTLPIDIFTEHSFHGLSTLTFRVTEKIRVVHLHTKEITLDRSKVQLRKSNGGEIIELTTSAYNSDPVTDILPIETGEDLVVNENYTLYFEYSGRLVDDDMVGLYKSHYYEDGETKYLATTQFQSVHARRVFPCLDEPKFKATFEITLNFPMGLMAVGNTPVKERTNDASTGLTTVTFQTTPRMSTYLLAFTISEFTCTKGEDIEKGIPYRVCSREETRNTRHLAVQVGPKLMQSMETFTGIKYSKSAIGKLDQLAIPDFSAGAMENWGLVTYREKALLWDDTESSNGYKQDVVTVIAHEFAHMWFGDIVTTHWWSDTFLNEGFAKFFEYRIPAKIYPEWELDKQFVVKELQSVLDVDSRISSDPLSLTNTSSPNDISRRFGSISYKKGGSIYRMVESFMDAGHFRAALSVYLKENLFENTTPEILWGVLNRFTHNLPLGKTMNDIMDNWTNKAGYPLLEVTARGKNVVFRQRRFLISGSDSTTWYVPISYTKSTDPWPKFNDTRPKVWLQPGKSVTISKALRDADWIILNNQQTGYYRVNYDNKLWNKISEGLLRPHFDGIHVLNRAQIVDDLFNLAKAGMHKYSRVLELVEFLRYDDDYYPWYSAYSAFSHMLDRTGNEQVYKALTGYISQLMKKLYESVPFEREDSEDQIYTLKKALALSWACKLQNGDCVKKARDAFVDYKLTNIRPSKNLRKVIYCHGLRNSSNIEVDWKFLRNKYEETTISTEENTILTALGCAKDKDILTKYLMKSIADGSGIRRQDALTAFKSVYKGSSSGINITLDFLLDNHVQISRYYKGMNALSKLISELADRFSVQAHFDKLGELIAKDNVDEELKTAAEKALKSAEENLKWTRSFEDQLTEHFKLGGFANCAKAGFLTLLLAALVLSHQQL